jgi:hypothetical protein
MIHRDGDMLFNRGLADAQAVSNLGVAQAIELVHPKDALRARRQLGDRICKPRGLVPFDQQLLRIRAGIGDFGRFRMAAVLVGSPVTLSPFATSSLAKAIEDEIVGHSKEIALGT